jgi:PAS domain S-box-containing protein
MITTDAPPGEERRTEPSDRREAARLQVRYEALIRQLDRAFVWEADANTRCISYVSAQLERLLGHSCQRGLAEPDGWAAHVPAEDRERLRQAFDRAREEPGNQHCEHRCLASDGSVRWLRTSIQLVGIEGESPHFQGVSFDITPTRAAQDELAEQHSERKHVQEGDRFLLGAGATLSASLESTAVVNAAARLGVPLLGDLCLVDVVAPDDRPRLVAWAHADPAAQGDLDRELGAGSRGPIFPKLVAEVIAIGRSLKLPIGADAWLSPEDAPAIRRLEVHHVLCVPLTLGARRLGALTFCMTGDRQHRVGDVTLAEKLGRRSALAIEHARLYAQARQAVALREQTLAIVSHDLRSPLATIVMAASILNDEEIARVNPRAKFLAVDKIQIAAARMERMIGDLLDFASIEAGRLSIETKPHEIAGIIEEATASFEAMAKKRQLKLTGVAFPPLPLIQCDRDRILQIISNLLSNALTIVPAEGAVSLRVKIDGKYAVFSVSDTGPGIALDNQERLFERYWRSRDAGYKGTGLGLAIARGLVEAHHGRIWVESELGHGATFHFTVPLAEPSPTTSRPQRRL